MHTLVSQGGILVQPTQNELDPLGCSRDLAGGMASRIHPNGQDFPPIRSSELKKKAKKALKWSKMACLSPFFYQLSLIPAILRGLWTLGMVWAPQWSQKINNRPAPFRDFWNGINRLLEIGALKQSNIIWNAFVLCLCALHMPRYTSEYHSPP